VVNILHNPTTVRGKVLKRAIIITSTLVILVLMSIYFGSERLGLNDPLLNRIHKAKVDLNLISESISLFRDKSGGCPSSLTEVLNGRISESKLLRIPNDPWENEYLYEMKNDAAGTKCVVWSMGADGKQGGSGDNQDIVIQISQ
jgi:hypothetical protein